MFLTFLFMVKVTLSLFVCMVSGVFLGNTFWNYNVKLMPWWFKGSLALVAISFFTSLFFTVFAAIWSIPS